MPVRDKSGETGQDEGLPRTRGGDRASGAVCDSRNVNWLGESGARDEGSGSVKNSDMHPRAWIDYEGPLARLINQLTYRLRL